MKNYLLVLFFLLGISVNVKSSFDIDKVKTEGKKIYENELEKGKGFSGIRLETYNKLVSLCFDMISTNNIILLSDMDSCEYYKNVEDFNSLIDYFHKIMYKSDYMDIVKESSSILNEFGELGEQTAIVKKAEISEKVRDLLESYRTKYDNLIYRMDVITFCEAFNKIASSEGYDFSYSCKDEYDDKNPNSLINHIENDIIFRNIFEQR